jgi:hypothetical protein
MSRTWKEVRLRKRGVGMEKKRPKMLGKKFFDMRESEPQVRRFSAV